MTETSTHTIERRCDVLVIGGSGAGLAAALQLGRQRRSVIVVDAREPRNAPATHMHGFLGRDGTPPAALIQAGRDEVRRYGVEVLDGRVVDVTGHAEEFRASLVGGHAVVSRSVVVATGLVDRLPDIEGVAEQWGRGVLHCPFCHGYEVRDQRLVQIATHPMSLHATPMFRQLTDDLIVVATSDVDEAELERLAASGISVVRGDVGAVRADDERVSHVELTDGTELPADAVVVTPTFVATTDALAGLGLEQTSHPTGLGSMLATDETGATSVPGVWAAGNVTDPMHQVLQAAANGGFVGAMVARHLADADLDDGTHTRPGETEWDRRYGGDQVWSGNPNGTLVAEIGDLTPGTALDVGAGEGGDALWLAEQGWSVTAADISAVGLGHIADEAERRGLDIACVHADANASAPFGDARFDLVTACYASIPRTTDDRAVEHLLGAVAPGGRLLMVGHDPAPMRQPIDPTATSRAFDPDAYVRIDDVAAALENDPTWTIEIHEVRSRPAGSASHAHHSHDAILRARRSTR